MIRFTVVIHRYLGLVGWTMFVVWFLSGFFMIYVEMPYLQQRATAFDDHPALRVAGADLDFHRAFAESGLTKPPRRARLTMLQGRPVYRFLPDGDGAFVSVFADTGARLAPLTQTRAEAIARNWRPTSRDTRFVKTLPVDQWTLYSNDFTRHRPFHKFAASDPAGTEIYVSTVTGMVAQATTRRERMLAYLGPVTHWIYPTFIRSRPNLWSWIVLVLSGFCILLALTGILAGLLRLRSRRAGGSIPQRISPFADVWMRWHHILGLLFALPVFAWIFSGFLSMTPGDWAPSRGATTAEQQAFAGSHRSPATLHPAAAMRTVRGRAFTTKAIDLVHVGGKGYYLLRGQAGRTLLVDTTSGEVRSTLSIEAIENAAGRLANDGMVRVRRLDDYDAYYYNRPGAEHNLRRLPAFRIDCRDATDTTYYVDARTARIALRMKRRSRWNRWLYNGLHSLDLPFLIERPSLRLGLLWVGLLGGTFLSITGLLLTIAYLRRRNSPKKSGA